MHTLRFSNLTSEEVSLGKHNRKSKYVGKHRATVVHPHRGKKITGVLAFSTILSLTPTMLGYEVVELPGMPGSAVIPPMTVPQSEVRWEVITEPVDDVTELNAPW